MKPETPNAGIRPLWVGAFNEVLKRQGFLPLIHIGEAALEKN